MWQEHALAKFECAWVCVKKNASMGCMCLGVGEQQPAGAIAQRAVVCVWVKQVIGNEDMRCMYMRVTASYSENACLDDVHVVLCLDG